MLSEMEPTSLSDAVQRYLEAATPLLSTVPPSELLRQTGSRWKASSGGHFERDDDFELSWVIAIHRRSEQLHALARIASASKLSSQTRTGAFNSARWWELPTQALHAMLLSNRSTNCLTTTTPPQKDPLPTSAIVTVAVICDRLPVGSAIKCTGLIRPMHD